MNLRQYIEYCKIIRHMRELEGQDQPPKADIDWITVSIFLFCCGITLAWVLFLEYIFLGAPK